MKQISRETYLEMRSLIEEYEVQQRNITLNTPVTEQQPYIQVITVDVEKKYNPQYDKENKKFCKCGHSYYRHFDSYEQMEACGCKYCRCDNFELAEPKVE